MGRGQVQIIQMTAAPDFCRRLGTFTITAINQGAKTFTIAENIEDRINDGGLTELTVQACTMPGGNDGVYTIVSATWDTDHTDIIVVEAIPSAVVEGEIVLVNDYDSYCDKLPIVSAENQPMWELANDKIYFGCLTEWLGFGVILATFGLYGAFTWEYYGDTPGYEDWREFEPMNDTTSGFSFRGVINWGVLSGWDEFTV